MRPTPAVAVSLTLALTVGACASTSTTVPLKAPSSAPRTARFDYTPSACAAPASLKLTLAIVAPAWQQPTSADGANLNTSLGNRTGVNDVQTRFKTALRDDFLELVTCRGAVTRGPFPNFDAMMFPDRDASDLLLEPIIESTIGLIEATRVARCKGFLGKAGCSIDAVSGSTPTSYSITGTIQLGGRIMLTLREPLTSTRMWTKSIEMPAERVRFTGETVFSAVSGTTPDLWADRGVQTVLAPALEEAYAAVLKAADGYLILANCSWSPRRPPRCGVKRPSASHAEWWWCWRSTHKALCEPRSPDGDYSAPPKQSSQPKRRRPHSRGAAPSRVRYLICARLGSAPFPTAALSPSPPQFSSAAPQTSRSASPCLVRQSTSHRP